MTPDQVIELMESSQTEAEWNSNCGKVKAAGDGEYPDFWYATIEMSGLHRRVPARWGSTGKMKISLTLTTQT